MLGLLDVMMPGLALWLLKHAWGLSRMAGGYIQSVPSLSQCGLMPSGLLSPSGDQLVYLWLQVPKLSLLIERK